MKALARELDIPVVAAAQLGRDSDNKRPTLADFQWSSQIEQDADVAILLWHQGKKGAEGEKSWWLIDKCRDGRTGAIQHRFERNFTTFTEDIDEGGY
jgi:replicative DNA helicase